MNVRPTLPPPPPITHFVAAALAAIISVAILVGVVELLQRDGWPLERLVVAERACAGYAYVSERDACVRQRLAASRSTRMASK